MQKRFLIEVSGIVQGVGFRPYVFRLSKRLQLSGFVKNNSDGVSIEIEGDENSANQFIDILSNQPPPLAQILNKKVTDIPPTREPGFHITKSDSRQKKNTLISPDIATCEDCLQEMRDPTDRRYLYPFINCTNCGPRYTIISDIPYDRSKTSMAGFSLCPRCQTEYDDPMDRRFHAQPNACSVCGPTLKFIGEDHLETSENPLELLLKALKEGQIAAIKGVGGFHLAADARNQAAVKVLRERKHRFEKPLALMVKDIQTISTIAFLNEETIIQLSNLHRPIVLCKKRDSNGIAGEIAPDNDYFGIMLPYSPLHEMIFQQGNLDVLVMTSANISEEPICFEDTECITRMKNIADCYLLHNRDIYIRCDDSVMHIFKNKPFFIRRSRGYGPRPVILSREGISVLAVGGHLKNTVCLTRENLAFLSQHIGDLENLQTLHVFEQTIDHLQTLFEVKPEYIVHDLHPEYMSTKWVEEETTVPHRSIQHHYAHILSVMAEFGIEKDIIGIALDGAGFGEDRAIWGGEVLLCNLHTYKRLAYFDYLPMPGGEKSIIEPWRMAVSYLLKYFENGSDLAVSFFGNKSFSINIIEQMIEKRLNTPMTSSCGRLFDAVAAILGLRTTVAYEGQAAVILESIAEKTTSDFLNIGKIEIVPENGHWILDPNEIMHNIVKYKINGKPLANISRAFHNALIDVFLRLVHILREQIDTDVIALSGGCFQNMRLLTGLYQQLEQRGFRVFTNKEVPVNDGGISLGQAYWGMHNCGKKA